MARKKDKDTAKVRKLEGKKPDPKSPKADARQDRLISMGVSVDLKKLSKRLKKK